MPTRTQVAKDHYKVGNNYLKKNEFGIWEMYLEGNAYERGLIYGVLAKELVQRQEDIFVGQIERFVPNRFWQQFLRFFIGLFNRNLPENISLENQQEIYGISLNFSDAYDFIGPKYARILNYHAAHDIGHALNNYSLVGCTSFALNDSLTADHQLILGRNFDFYVGDEFAEDKLILFLNPSKGYKFASYSWAGFTGVASGLNEKGLSVTINAAKSDLPSSSKTPISLLAREILQYASNIDEAVTIAKKRKIFVSESLMIGSAKDKKAILIEKTPTKTAVFESKTNRLICSNHFQSNTFKNDPINLDNIRQSDSKARYNRVQELLFAKEKFNVQGVIDVLRDQYDLHGDTLGMGNPKAINQLIAHHSVVFQPEERKMYISSNDFQLGTFVGYQLDSCFQQKKALISSLIPASPFVYSTKYQSFLIFKKTKQHIQDYVLFNTELTLSEKQIKAFIQSNSESFVTYFSLGSYFLKKQAKKQAKKYFEQALLKPLDSKQTELEIKEAIRKCL